MAGVQRHASIWFQRARWGKIVFVIATSFASTAWPQELNPQLEAPAENETPHLTLDKPPTSVWTNGIGSGFRKDTIQAGFSAGAGFSTGFTTHLIGGTESHQIALGTLQAGWIFTDPVAESHWWRGNWELLGSAFGGEQFYKHDAYLTGLTAALRYNFATGTRLIPFFGGGGGPSYTDIGPPDLGSRFEFNLNADLGFHWFFREDLAATAQYRWLHLSNAGIQSPNQGVNCNFVLVGLNWFF